MPAGASSAWANGAAIDLPSGEADAAQSRPDSLRILGNKPHFLLPPLPASPQLPFPLRSPRAPVMVPVTRSSSCPVAAGLLVRAFPARRHSLRRPLARAFGLAPRQIRPASAFRSASTILALQKAALGGRRVSRGGVFRETSGKRRLPTGFGTPRRGTATVALRAEHAFRTVNCLQLLLIVGSSFLQSGSRCSRAASAGPS